MPLAVTDRYGLILWLVRSLALSLSSHRSPYRSCASQAVVNEGCVGSQQALQAEIARLKAALAARPTLTTTLLPTGASSSGAASGGHGAAGGGGGAKVDAWTRRLSLAVHPARQSLAAVLGVNLEEGDGDGDGDGGGGGDGGAVSGTPLAHRIACLQTCVKRLEEQLCIVQVDRDAAHKQQAGYISVLAAKDQQVVALRMQLRMARDQMTKPSKLPRPSAIAASPGPRMTITALAPITAPELAPSSQPPSTVTSAHASTVASTVTSAHASTVASPVCELPPPADAPWRAASTPSRMLAAEVPRAPPHAPPPPPPPPPRLPPSTTPAATVLSALAAGGVSAAALAALTSADLAIIEARAVEASGLRAEVLKATHERCSRRLCVTSA